MATHTHNTTRRGALASGASAIALCGLSAAAVASPAATAATLPTGAASGSGAVRSAAGGDAELLRRFEAWRAIGQELEDQRTPAARDRPAASLALRSEGGR